MNNFLNSEQKIIYAKKRANNFINDLCKIVEIVYTENSEQFLWENSEQFYLMQKTDFMNVVSKFKYTVNMMCREKYLLMKKQILLMQKNIFDYSEIQTWKSIQIWRLNLENMISLGVLWENNEQFFK